MSFEQILSLDALTLLDWLIANFSVSLPNSIASYNEMNQASEFMVKLTGYYTYLMQLSSYAKIKKRIAKRELSKTEFEDLVDKEDIISKFADCIKQQYSAISRAVTIRIENNKELLMNSDGHIRN